MKITNINHWIDAFLIFASIFSFAHPESTSGLFKYMHTVRLGAKRSSGLGFKFYDEQYRLRKASNPSSSWGIVDQELWLLYMFYVINRAVPLFLPAVEISNVIHLIFLGAARNLSVFMCINVLHAQGLVRQMYVSASAKRIF